MTIRVVYHKDDENLLGIYADHEIEFYHVNEGCPRDRVYRFTPGQGVLRFGKKYVDDAIGKSPIGHYENWPREHSYQESDIKK